MSIEDEYQETTQERYEAAIRSRKGMTDMLMTNRGMLELAAKACGLKHVDYSGSDYSGSLGLQLVDGIGRHTLSWNPLEDDGDAFRLAIKLKILVDPRSALKAATSKSTYAYHEHLFGEEGAMRWAIVRAAAEIGKGM